MNAEYFMDPETGHVLPVELSPERIDDTVEEAVDADREEFFAEEREERAAARQERAAERAARAAEGSVDEDDDDEEDDPDADEEEIESTWCDTREESSRARAIAWLARVDGFFAGAPCIRKDAGARGLDVYDVDGFHFAVYDAEDGFGERFPNCVLMASTESERRRAAEALGLPCIEGAVDGIFARHTGLIDRDDVRGVRTRAA